MNPTTKRLLEDKADGKIRITGTVRRSDIKIGRNKKCYCGSNIKYKKCCLLLERKIEAAARKAANTDYDIVPDFGDTEVIDPSGLAQELLEGDRHE